MSHRFTINEHCSFRSKFDKDYCVGDVKILRQIVPYTMHPVHDKLYSVLTNGDLEVETDGHRNSWIAFESELTLLNEHNEDA